MFSCRSLTVAGRVTGTVNRDARDAQLQRLIGYAAAHVPFYRRLFSRHGIEVSSTRSESDLERIPVTSREDFQQAGLEQRLSDEFSGSRLFQRSTSGTSGQPLTIACSLFEESVLSCLRVLAWRRLGVSRRDRLVRLKIIIASRHRPRWISLLQRWGAYREVPIDCLQPPERILAEILALKPSVILSFPEILARVAERNGGRRLPFLRRLLVGGETLTRNARHQIQEGFGIPVLDLYASHEFNQMAVECNVSGLLHVNEESIFVEILKDGKMVAPGESGEAVVTGLHSFAMPFIRYRIGDILTRGPDSCPCGREGLTIERIQGRKADAICLPDGSQVHPFAVILELGHEFSWIKRYRLTQEADGRLTVELVPLLSPPEDSLETLRARISAVLNRQIQVDVRTIGDLEPGSLGKYQVCRSLLTEQASKELN